MKNEFVLAFNEVLEEKQLPREVILEAIEAAMVSAYRRAVTASIAQEVKAQIDLETGKVAIFAEKEVVDNVQDPRTEVSLEEARKVDQEVKIGSMVIVESTPQDFGRVAAQTARQVIQQRIREAERNAQMEYFSKQVGEVVSGVTQAINSQGVTLGLEMKAEGIMPPNHQIPYERYPLHERVRALLTEVKSSPRGPQLILSRAHRNFLRRLLENEVPEIYHGMVEIRSIAREPGQRSKVAVSALQPGVDPVGACVGMRGVRIQAIVRELHGEKIDVIEWNPDPAIYIMKALSPARVTGVYLNEQNRTAKTAMVVVPEDQLSLAIGRDGQNARLAAKLTSWRIDIKSLLEATADVLHKLQNDPEYAALASQEATNTSQIEAVLTKKSEGRPVTPEEYTLISQFVDRVEKGVIYQRQAEQKVEKDRRDAILATIPIPAFVLPLEDLNLTENLHSILSEAGYNTVGDLMLQLKLDADTILGLNGVGPKAMEIIHNALEQIAIPEVQLEISAVEPIEIITSEETEVVAEVIAQPQPPIEAIPVEIPQDIELETSALPVNVELVNAEEELLGEPKEVGTEEKEVELPASLDEIFALRPEVFEYVSEETEEDGEEEAGKKKKKKKKKKFVEVEYDPDKDVTIVKRKRKRGVEGWEEDWSL